MDFCGVAPRGDSDHGCSAAAAKVTAMAQLPPETGETARRAFDARWLLAVAAILCAGFAWLEPHRLWHAVVAFAALATVLALLPRRSPVRNASGRDAAQAAAWPDTSTKAVVEALGHPAYVVDGQGVLRYANASAEAAFGPARAGDPLSYKFRRPEVARLIEGAIAGGGRAVIDYEERVPRERWFAMSVAPIPVAGGARPPRFFLLSFVDMTEVRRAEQMRSDFVANASHELRTPLASLRGFVETIQGPAANDRAAVKKFLALMLEQAERMSRLIDDLLSLSRIEMKSHVRPEKIIDLSGVLRHVVHALEPMAAGLKVEIALSLPEGALPVRGERDELIQVAENLVENAAKYGQSGGRIEVNVTRVAAREPGQAAEVEVAVRDFGPGIAAEHLPRLTERFYRVDIASSRQKQGTGLGLAIVKHILARHGARLSVASQPGQGAEFSFRLPLDTAPALDGSK